MNPLVCKHCHQPGRFVRTRYFDTENAEVYECTNQACTRFNLIWHVQVPKPKGERTTAALLTILEAYELPESLDKSARAAIAFDAENTTPATPDPIVAELGKLLSAASRVCKLYGDDDIHAFKHLNLAIESAGTLYKARAGK
jgi:hypothetical protein